MTDESSAEASKTTETAAVTDATATTDASAAAVTTTTTETAPEKPWYQKIYDADGKYVKAWQENLPPELEEYKGIAATFDTPAGMFKALKDNMAAARSKGNVKPLTPESTPEEIADYRAKMGIPTEPYKFEKPEKLPDGVEWKEDRVKAFGEWAHSKNLTEAQAKEALELHVQFLAEDQAAIATHQQEHMQQLLAKEQETLKLMFGGMLDTTVVAAKRAALWGNLPTEAFDPSSPTFLGPQMLAYAAKVAEMLGEGKLPTTAAVTNMDELAQAADIQKNPNNPDHAQFMAGNMAIFKKVEDLTKRGLERRHAAGR